jgi:ketosteroid isomerase-like protein
MLTHTRARELIESSHEAWRRGDLEGLLGQYADDMAYWCNAGDPSGGPVEIKGKAAFRETLAAVLRTTLCDSHILSFDFDGTRARTKAHYRLERRGTAVVLEGTYRQVISYKGGLISRLEEYHDAGRLTAFWQLTSGDAKPKAAVWDAESPVRKPRI